MNIMTTTHHTKAHQTAKRQALQLKKRFTKQSRYNNIDPHRYGVGC